MAYNSYYDIEKIVGLKGAYDEAKKRNDQKAMNDAANGAQPYYNNLIKNNYGDVANQLKNSGYNEAQKIKTATGTKGKTAIRPYFYNLGKQYGLNQNDVDKALSFNEATGEVSLGGKNIGTPYTNVDGTTYWEADKLKNIWDDYTSSMGISKTPEVRYNQGMDNIQKKLDSTYNLTKADHDNMNKKYDRLENYGYSNPYESEIADSIMEDYKWKGAKASDEAIASGGGSNGGNIDSYSAANASRQQLAFTNAGKAAVLEDFNNRIANIRNVLADLGNYNQGIYDTQHQNAQLDMQNNQRVFENGQNEAQNKLQNDISIAEVTGYIPQSMSTAMNPFFDENGNLKNVDNIDYQAIINEQEERLKNATDATERADAQQTIRWAKEARANKVQNYDRYNKWLSTLELAAPEETAGIRQANENRASNERINLDANYTSRYNADSTNNASMHNSDNALALGKYESDNNLAGIMDTNATNRYATDTEFNMQKWLAENGYLSSGTETTSSSAKKEAAKNEADKKISNWLYSVEGLDPDNTYRGYDGGANVQYVAAEKISDSEIVQDIKDTLISSGYTAAQADNKISEYKLNIAKQVAQIEGLDPNDEYVLEEIFSRYGM